MSLRDASISVVRGLAAGALLALAGSVSGCQVHALYATMPATEAGQPGQSMTDALRSVKIESPIDSLEFLFYGGAEPLPAKTYLKLIYAEQQTDLGIQQFGSVPQAELVTGTVTFTLTDIKSHDVIAEGTSFATASYNVSSQPFSNIRARKDAQTRAQDSIAQDLRVRIAAALADYKPQAAR